MKKLFVCTLVAALIVIFTNASYSAQPWTKTHLSNAYETVTGIQKALGRNYIYTPNNGVVKEFRQLPRTPHVQGEIIIKFKDAISELALGVAEGRSNFYDKAEATSLDKLSTKYKVKKMERIIDGLGGIKNRRQFLEHVRSVWGKHARRNIKDFLENKVQNLHNIYLLKFESSTDIEVICREYEKDPNVEYAEPNYIAYTSATIPNDPDFPQQWALNNTGQTGGTADADIDAPEAWDRETGDPSVIIAVVDTGIDWNHPDLTLPIWTNEGEIQGDSIDNDGNGYVDDVRGWDFVSVSPEYVYPGEDPGPSDNNPMDFHGHGTHCSGIIGATTNNSEGIAGICWHCRIMAVRAGYKDTSGYGSLAYSDITSAIIYASDNGADIINMSFGGSSSSTLQNAIDYAHAAGVILIAAAGNDSGTYLSYPAGYDSVLAVSAFDHNDNKASFSTYGHWIDVAAPGVSIYSTYFDDTYATFSGTSMAAPHVCGVAGLILSHNPPFSNEEVRQILRVSADDVSTTGWDEESGYGRINAYNALQISSVCIATIETPSLNEDVKGTVGIIGTALGAHFQYYELYYGEGTTPTSWTKIGTTSYSEVDKDVLKNLETTIIADGQYTIKLVVVDSFLNEFIDRRVINVRNVPISFPLNNDILRAGEVIEIQGSASAPNFLNYTIDYGIGEEPSAWFNDGIILVNNGSEPIIEDTLATWNTSSITQSDWYTIRLTINYNDETYGEKFVKHFAKNLYLDPTLKEGWPVRIPCDYNESEGYYIWGGFIEPVIEDLNKDGNREVIIFKGGMPPQILVYNYDGSLLWSRSVGTEGVPGGNLHIPLVGDIDSDGYDEIITYNPTLASPNSNVYAFNHDGSDLWSVEVPKDYKPTMLMADLDLDGYNEIVIKGNDAFQEKMVIINNEGEIISQWDLPNVTWGSSIESSPAIGNFDDNPDLEIISASPSENAGYNWETGEWINEGVIYVYERDGSVVNENWPVHTDGVIFSSPVTGDINHDGKDEIVVGLFYEGNYDENYGGVYAFDRNGNILPTVWPVEKGYSIFSTPALGDIDNDEDLEISVSRWGFVTNLFHHDGTLMWSQDTTWNDYYSSIIGDITNDGYPDILTTAGSGFYPSISNHGGVYAWNNEGMPVEGFPKVTEVDAQAPAAIADIDKDGNVELIASSDWDMDLITGTDKCRGTIYVWELEASYEPSTIHWPMFQHDPQHTGRYAKPDADNDGIHVIDDNCPTTPNPNQEDTDNDGIGDACDNCPNTANTNQQDTDKDYQGDACDECTDTDGDGFGNPEFLINTCSDDNCPNTPNPDQQDTYPPQGNGIGDACDCEGNFDCDQDVDANDVSKFLWDFGRNEYYNPCINGHQCYGDFSCDGDVDAQDVTKFLEDFGRSQYYNPCPVCNPSQTWCVY